MIMGDVVKVILKLFIGMVMIGAGSTLIRNVGQDAGKTKIGA